MQSRLIAQCRNYCPKEQQQYAHSTKKTHTHTHTRQLHCTCIANKIHTELKLHTQQNHYTRNTNILNIALVHFIWHKRSKSVFLAVNVTQLSTWGIWSREIKKISHSEWQLIHDRYQLRKQLLSNFLFFAGIFNTWPQKSYH